jgi:gas vesicle protein
MSTADLDLLEEDVAAARRRLTDDVARLRSPTTISGFKQDVAQSVSGSVHGAAAGLKNRAAANPLAVAAIGAGLLWRFAQRPPIATLLIGFGLVSLFRTSPASPPSPVVTRASELAHSTRELAQDASERVTELSERARELGEQARDTAQATAAQVTERVSQFASGASEQASRLTSRASQQAAQLTARASEEASHIAARASQSADRVAATAGRIFPDRSPRDAFLLGVAALAIGVAAVISSQRRAS